MGGGLNVRPVGNLRGREYVRDRLQCLPSTGQIPMQVGLSGGERCVADDPDDLIRRRAGREQQCRRRMPVFRTPAAACNPRHAARSSALVIGRPSGRGQTKLWGDAGQASRHAASASDIIGAIGTIRSPARVFGGSSHQLPSRCCDRSPSGMPQLVGTACNSHSMWISRRSRST